MYGRMPVITKGEIVKDNGIHQRRLRKPANGPGYPQPQERQGRHSPNQPAGDTPTQGRNPRLGALRDNLLHTIGLFGMAMIMVHRFTGANCCLEIQLRVSAETSWGLISGEDNS